MMYKVVIAYPDNSLHSYYSEAHQAVTYEVGKWTRRREKCGGLLVFDTLENVREFTNLGKIYTCETDGPLPLPDYAGSKHLNHMWPFGTLAFERVKLTGDAL